MHNDNMYPLDGQPFALRTPQKQAEDRQKEISETLDQLPLLKQVVKRLDKQIAHLDSLNSIQVNIDQDPLTFQKVHAANQMSKSFLTNERNYILTRIERTLSR